MPQNQARTKKRPPMHGHRHRYAKRLGQGFAASFVFHAVLAWLSIGFLRPSSPDAGTGGGLDGGRTFQAGALVGLRLDVVSPEEAPPSRQGPTTESASATPEIGVEPQTPAKPGEIESDPEPAAEIEVVDEMPQKAPEAGQTVESADSIEPESDTASGSLNPDPAATPVSGQEGHRTEAGSGGGGEIPVIALKPLVWAPPSVDTAVKKKLKGNSMMLLQALVGEDGRVLEVRVLRAIPKCRECNEELVRLVRRFEYESVVIDGVASKFWTEPFPFGWGQP